MRLSNKSTFSLACFILLLAFVVTPAMAHDLNSAETTNPHNIAGNTDADADHVAHAVVESIEALGDAADGYVGTDSFIIAIEFDSAGGTPIAGAFTAANIDIAGESGTWSVRDVTGSGLSYRARILPDSTATSDDEDVVISLTGDVLVSAEPGATAQAIYSPPDEADGTNPAKAVVNLDVTPPALPAVGATGAPTISGERSLTDLTANQWSGPFDVEFTITGSTTDMSLDLSTITVTAEPDVFTFDTNVRSIGPDRFAVTATPKAKTTTGDETAATPVTITISVDDKADNTGMTTISVNLAPRTGATPNRAPAFASGSSISDITATAGTAITNVTLPAATDADGDALTYSITPAVGNGLTFNAGTRRLSGTPIAAMAQTVYTYTVSDGTADATLTFNITVNAAATGGPVSSANKLEGLVIPGKSFVLLTHADPEGLPETLSSDATVVWNDMPDLEALFYSGGSINITVPDVGNRSVLFTEFMWARNLAKVGTAGELAHQWIEIYNNNADDVTATVMTKAGRPALAHGTDRVSNVVGGGWAFTGLGQNGSDDGEGGSAEVDFVSMYKKNKSAGDKDGSNKGHWGVSSEVYLAYHKGTPGKFERSGVPVIGTYNPSLKPAIINEVANRDSANKQYEWIEILVTEGSQRFKNWEVEIITAVGAIKRVFTLPEIPGGQAVGAGKVLLVTATDPASDPNHPLAPGYNVQKNNENQALGVGPNHPVKYIVRNFENELPNDGKFVLTLRTRNDRNNHEGVIDIAGWHDNLGEDTGTSFTNLWPLSNYPAPSANQNRFHEDTVHRRQHTGITGTKRSRTDRGDNADDGAFRDHGWTSIGYKRNTRPSNAHGGTPGYLNNTLKSEGGDATNNVVISEIMFDTSRNTPQWIELQNLSSAYGINVNNWSIFVKNYHLMDPDTDYTAGQLTEKRFDIDGYIPPNQTMLIVTHASRSHTLLPAERVHNLRLARGPKLLNPYGFQITLKAKTNKGANEHQTVDVVGNLGDAPAGSRRSDAQSYADLAWMLPSGTSEDGVRVSIARKTDEKIQTLDGRKKWSWVSSDDDPRLGRIFQPTYYGLSSDISSPGQTRGTPLPVNLSTFRPTLEDGKVVIHWTTESELDNAGFNILRSETRNGEYKQVNSELIAGHGTTGERHTYKWVDQTAKPGVVYYYQIEDVSFAGEHQVLAVTKLRGLISAKNKLTTTWGELKSQD